MAGTQKAAFKVSLLSGVVALSTGLTVFAQGAPIAFGEASTRPMQAPTEMPRSQIPQQTMRFAAPDSTQVASTVAADPRKRRIEFRYPDQPNTFYGEGGARAADIDEAPMAFSSAETAISQEAARQYAAVSEPEIARDPAITSGGFDARAAARAVEARQRAASGQPTRITATQPPKPAPTGQPLTLSKVRANSGASVSQESGLASVYDRALNGERTANGEVHDRTELSAAHRTLPLPSLVQVINDDNGREIVVRVNDRGPFNPDRVIDLSERAAEMLGIDSTKSANVTLRYLGPAPVLPAKSDSTASVDVVSQNMAQPQRPTVRDPFVQEPSLGVPDPIEASAPASRPAGLGNIYVQVGSFSDIGNAESLNAAIGRSLPVEIESAKVRGSDYFRVLVGPFQTRGEAERQRAQLSRAGIADGFITSR
ncbi:MAG: septal ring lytic transglycosylase RlpA family protein [Pseudomonadota bacterium]